MSGGLPVIVISDNQEGLKLFLEQKLKIKFWPPYFALGFATNEKKPICVVLFNEYNGANIELTIYADRGMVTRTVIRYLAEYVFNQLKCRRLTVRTKKRNKSVLKLAPRLGFKYENVVSRYFPDDDAVVFRMLREDCKWIRQDANLDTARAA